MSTLKKSLSSKSIYHHGNLVYDLKKYAIKMIRSKGVKQLSLRQLATKCGVSATAVYRHYESKEHLLAAIALDGFYELQKAMLESIEPYKLKKIGVAYINFALQNPVKFQLMFGALLKKENHPTLYEESQKAYYILRDEVVENIKQGYMADNIDSLTRTAWATVHGTAMLLLDNQFVIQKNEVIDSNQIILEITRVLGQGLFVKTE